MKFTIKRELDSPKSVMIEPWALDINLEPGDELSLDIEGLNLESDIWFEFARGDRLVIYSEGIERVYVKINGVDVSKKYRFL